MNPNLSGPEAVGFLHHDHTDCVAEALSAAEHHCDRKGLRFTPVRRRALEILLEEHRAIGAYEMLGRLQAEGLGAQPPAAYRALDFLVAQHFAHKVERLNAFVACAHPGADHAPAFLICRGCSRVAETLALPLDAPLDDTIDASGFLVEKVVFEAEGICAECQSKETS